MTALLEMKQKIKNFYGSYEAYLLPLLKFVLAFLYFYWINSSLDFSDVLSNIFIVLILALLCAILPSNCMVLFGFVLIIGQCYSVGIEVAAVVLVLVILMYILFLRFSANANLALMFTPIGFMFHVPVAIPVGCGLLGGPLTAAPASCGVILYYFIEMIKEQAAILQGKDMEALQKVQLLLDGLMKNTEMWVTLVAFAAVILLVFLIRTRSLDYAWRIAVVLGVIVYAAFLLAGGLFLEMNVSIVSLAVAVVVAVIIGIIIEFFAFGGDYTRTEHLQYEDDDYIYYVKAVPKASIATSEREIKKINGRRREERSYEEPVRIYEPRTSQTEHVPVEIEIVAPKTDVDFESKLEESLKDL